jgi:hypothetical protein
MIKVWLDGIVVNIKHSGNQNLAEAKTVSAFVDGLPVEFTKPLFLMLDARGMGGMTEEARQWHATWARRYLWGGVALFGASWLYRTVVLLVVRAILLIAKTPIPIAFFIDEASARTWLLNRGARFDASPLEHGAN